jgi:hypothetical protein
MATDNCNYTFNDPLLFSLLLILLVAARAAPAVALVISRSSGGGNDNSDGNDIVDNGRNTERCNVNCY